MTKTTYRVHLTNAVSTVIEVEAYDEEQARDLAFNSDRSLSLMFLDHHYPDEGDWEVAEVEAIGVGEDEG
ncbi:hypothetical protein [Kineococcus esterisolvens]|uniref:hypothetical protein n=1 Tax=unclassified Kineococcus TaxID=2621656 RepID=UPI003D7CD7D7